MSTRCSYEGCDLTYEPQLFSCPCCGSRFAFDGRVINGPATEPLPWFQVSYRDNHLYADSGQLRPPEARYSTPEIEEAIAKLRQAIAEKGTKPGVEVPDILLNRGLKKDPADKDAPVVYDFVDRP